MNAINISKEDIRKYQPAKTEVLSTKEAIIRRFTNLLEAMKLGNLYKQKAKIKFLTEQGSIMEFEATIWFASEKHTFLKGGMMLPNHSIIEITY
jgi:glutamate racemase